MEDRNNKKNKITNEEYNQQYLNEDFNDNIKAPARKITLNEVEMKKLFNEIEKENDDLIDVKNPIEKIKNQNHEISTSQSYVGAANYGPARNVKYPKKSLFYSYRINKEQNQNNK